MNKSEKIMFSHMTFKTGRGRTLKGRTDMWLKGLREERKKENSPFEVQIGIFHRYCDTYRRAKIALLGTLYELNRGKRDGNYDGVIKDANTQIVLFESW